jgi:hypothetical protein
VNYGKVNKPTLSHLKPGYFGFPDEGDEDQVRALEVGCIYPVLLPDVGGFCAPSRLELALGGLQRRLWGYVRSSLLPRRLWHRHRKYTVAGCIDTVRSYFNEISTRLARPVHPCKTEISPIHAI